MTFNRKNNHFNVISVFKLIKNVELYEFLGLFCQKLTIQNGRRRPFWIDANKNMKEKNKASPLHMLDDMCAQFQDYFQISPQIPQLEIYAIVLWQRPNLNLIDENPENPRRLWDTINNILHRTPAAALPESNDVKSLCEHFAKYFCDKIRTIRANFSNQVDDVPSVQKPKIRHKLFNLEPASEDEDRKIIIRSALKSCDLDPIPTNIQSLVGYFNQTHNNYN